MMLSGRVMLILVVLVVVLMVLSRGGSGLTSLAIVAQVLCRDHRAQAEAAVPTLMIIAIVAPLLLLIMVLATGQMVGRRNARLA